MKINNKNNLASYIYSCIEGVVMIFLAAVMLLPGIVHGELKSLCAEIRMEIPQTLTLERQAFDAHMRINNEFEHISLEDIDVTVSFTDDDENIIIFTSDPNNTNALFFMVVESMDNISDVSGSGVVQPSTSADIHWLIIPAPGAGGDVPDGMRYNIGATFTYTMGGEDYELDVVPDTIRVHPMPLLTLDYFLPTDVYGDDAFTIPVEAPVAFSLGVRVSNDGYGDAKQLKIDSGQPKIIENELGLLVGFSILGSEVNGGAVSDSMLVDFGTIDPASSGVARWIMECSLSGQFTEFTASFSHSDRLGGELTSLIEEVNTHFLVHDVLVELPGRDQIRDFLASEGEESPVYTVYESDNVDVPVSNMSAAAVLNFVSADNETIVYTLAVPQTSGPLYVKTAFSNSTDSMSISSAIRSDGKQLDLANVWFAKTRETGTDPWEHTLNLFDVNGGGNYTITINDISAVEQPPVLAYIGDKTVWIGDLAGLGFIVEASDPNGTVPEITSTPLPTGASFVTETKQGIKEGVFLWTPAVGQDGIYPVEFTASDGVATDSELIKIYVGKENEGTNSAGLPESLAGWSVEITNVVASTTGETARVQWGCVPGIRYDVYASDDTFADTGMNWTLVATNEESASLSIDWLDETLGTNRLWRYYQVVFENESAMSNGVWGVVRHNVTSNSMTFFGPPLRRDLLLDGVFGQELATELSGDDAGPSDMIGDEIYILRPDGAWRVIYLDQYSVWREGDGSASTAPLLAGHGMILSRNGPSTRLTVTGKVGNDLTQEAQVQPGWNLLALSEGRELLLSKVFDNVIGNGPVGHIMESEADQIIIWDEQGVAHWLMFVAGWGTPYDDNWVDIATYEIIDRPIKPGAVIYYYRQAIGGTMRVKF